MHQQHFFSWFVIDGGGSKGPLRARIRWPHFKIMRFSFQQNKLKMGRWRLGVEIKVKIPQAESLTKSSIQAWCDFLVGKQVHQHKPSICWAVGIFGVAWHNVSHVGHNEHRIGRGYSRQIEQNLPSWMLSDVITGLPLLIRRRDFFQERKDCVSSQSKRKQSILVKNYDFGTL